MIHLFEKLEEKMKKFAKEVESIKKNYMEMLYLKNNING